MVKKRKSFLEVCREIKEIKIQGARNIAGWALYAYLLKPTKASIKKLKSLRPTEPMLSHVLDLLDKGVDHNKILDHFDSAQKKINEFVLDLIEDNDIIYTHCHSTNVIQALVYAKKKGRKFEVYNTETRPLFQGRKTANDLRKAKIKVTMFVDSGMDVALSEKHGTKEVTKIFIGADALLKKGVINKIGSGMLSKLSKVNKVPLYIIADSWKHSPKNVKIEERKFHEVWEKMPKSFHVKIKNPAFELVPRKYIKGIITEFGLMKYKKFLRVVKKV